MGETVPSPSGAGQLRSLGPRWLQAALLRPAAYSAVRSDPHALTQAAAVVLLAGLGRGLGVFPEEGWIGVVGGTALGLVMWMIASVLVWAIGVRGLGHGAGFPELLRTLGFAAVPLPGLVVCAALGPPGSRWVWGLFHAWSTLAFALAVRTALGVPTLRALWICAAALASALALLLTAATFLLDAVLMD